MAATVQHAKETLALNFKGAVCWCLVIFTVALLHRVNEVVGTKCGNPPQWTPRSRINSTFPLLTIDGTAFCTAENTNGYPVPGSEIWNMTTFPNGTTANVSYCVAGSAVHPVFNSTTYKVLVSATAFGDRSLSLAVRHPAVGLKSIKLPQCTVTADGWNVSRVDPLSGPLYVGWPASNYGAASTVPGAYIPGAGVMNGWLASPWMSYLSVLSYRKALTGSEPFEKNFACYEGLGATGTLMKNFTVLGSRTNCMTSCLMNATCIMTTVTYKQQPAAFGLMDSTLYQIADYSMLIQKDRRVSRHLVECRLFTGGSYVGNATENTMLCTKLLD